jgi:hypothetical protein
MQPWQIQAFELESSGLKHLDGFVQEHALYFLIGAIYLLLALLVVDIESIRLSTTRDPAAVFITCFHH